MLLDLDSFYKSSNKDKYDWYSSLPDEEKNCLSIYDEIVSDVRIQQEYVRAFNFFIKEDVAYDQDSSSFIIFIAKDDSINIVGAISVSEPTLFFTKIFK